MKSRSETLDRFVKAFLFYAIMEYYKNLSLEPIKYFCEFDLIWKTEEWKDVPNYEGKYQVSDLGRLKCFRKNKYYYLKQRFNQQGYLRTTIHFKGIRKTKSIHKLVAISFLGHIPNGNILVINHKNFIKRDNRKVNIEIVTNRENSNRKHCVSSSKYVGVDYHKRTKKWRARIVYNGDLIHLGLFDREIDASIAYNKKLKEITDARI